MTLVNWLLALVAASLWIGVFTWYFWRDVKRSWKTRNDKWFRSN